MKPIIKKSFVLLMILVIAYRAFSQTPNISYATPPIYYTGSPIQILTPTNTGGAPAINGQASLLAGNTTAGFADGTGAAASFSHPAGIVCDAAGNIYVSDSGNERIRKITPAGVVTTLAGNATAGFADGTGSSAKFNTPNDIAIDASGNIYVADTYNYRIRKITSAGVVTTIAGSGTVGSANGTGTAASFNMPTGLAVDPSGNMYVVDNGNNLIRKITSAGVVTTFAGSGSAGSANGTGTAASFNSPTGVCLDPSGNLFIADKGNFLIRMITPAGVVTTLAGSGTGGTADGTGSAASFNYPRSVVMDAQGMLYVADQQNNKIRKITSAGVVTTLSGTGTAGSNNAAGSSATFYNPFAVTIDPVGNLYIADYSNNEIRKVASTAFTLSQPLPSGLSFNGVTGAISGTASAVSSLTAYTATAYNLSGSSNASLNITVNAPLPGNPSTNQNYILTYSPRVAVTNASSLPSQLVANVNQTIQYIDGLGRPIQAVQLQASPTERDIVQPMAYDAYGREATKYLPYSVLPTTASDGSYKTTALTDQASFYTNPTNSSTWNSPGVVATPFPTSVTAFEPSPLDRAIEQGATGDNWQLTGTTGATSPGHTVKIVYATNNASNLTSGTGYWAKNYGVNYLYTYDGHYLYKNGLADNGSYAIDVLYVTVSKNENWLPTQSNLKWNTVEQYKDKFGRLLVKRTYNYNNNTGLTETYSTYYIYDDYNNLTFVLPPGANPDAGGITQSTLDNLCYQYRYDGRNRIVGKKIPGKGWELTLYNQLDQPVASQDSVQRMMSPQQWSIIKYDAMGRPALTGIYQYTGSTAGVDYRANLQSLVDAQTNQWETPLTSGNGYSANTWPTTWLNTLTLNYYDNYSNIPSLPYSYTSASNMVRGQLTAAKVAILNSPATMLWSQQYYDDKNRVVKAYKQHYLGGVASINNYDLVTTTYNFIGQPTTVIRQHWNTTSNSYPLVTIANTYLYDQIGRKVKAWEQITNGNNTPTTKTLVSLIDYNEVGQVLNKHLHSTDSVNFFQNIAYTYNERGWVLTSSAALFAMQLYFNTGTNKDYTGNVMYQYWGTPANLSNYYIYTYDKLNRLLSGFSTAGNNESVAYDLMGNISGLQRYTASVPTDGLSYSYTSGGNPTNQLQSVLDGSGSNTGLVNGTTAYTYDGNGNMLSGTNTGNHSQDKSFSYNLVNLPQVATVPLGTITYTYDAGGNKLRKVSTVLNNTTDYIAGIQYDGQTTPALSFIQTEEGKAVPNGTNYDYTYYLGDNLGNTRVTFDTKTGVAVSQQTNDYYPFGMEILGNVTSPKNEYLYNKKEKQEELAEYDYGARFYDPIIARWNTIDPLAEKSRRWSPYSYVEDNPMRFIDPDGMSTSSLFKGNFPPSDFFDKDGNKIGTDGHPEYTQKYVVTDKTEAQKIAKTDKAGGTTQVDDVTSAKLLPSTTVLNQSLKVLNAQVNGGTPNEKLPSVVTPDGSVVEGQTGGAPVVTKNANGTSEVTVPSTLPAFTTPTALGAYNTVDIHPHPVTGFVIGGIQFPAIPASGTPLDAADTQTFQQHQTNIIVGRLGSSTGKLGVSIYHGTTPALDLTQSAVQKIVNSH